MNCTGLLCHPACECSVQTSRMILDNQEEHRTEETIIGKLVRWFSLTREQAKMYYDKYARVVV